MKKEEFKNIIKMTIKVTDLPLYATPEMLYNNFPSATDLIEIIKYDSDVLTISIEKGNKNE